MKYSTMFDVAFTVEHEYEDPNEVPIDAILKEMQERLEYLREHKEEAKEAFGHCDTYEISSP